MTTEGFAKSTVEQMMALRAGQRPGKVFTAHPNEYEWKYFHLALSGIPKVGKSHLGLSATTHEIRKPDSMGTTMPPVRTPGEILIPSKPLKVAYANFDRPANTVVDNLPAGAEFYEEKFYLNEDGEPYHPLELKDDDFSRLFIQLDEFNRAAIKAGFDLVFVDGGTITWEFVRRWRLPPPKKQSDGEMGNAPKDYAGANLTMRTWVQRLYSSDIHSIISMEAREKWSSASKPDLTAAGTPVMILDGWNKVSHYTDMTGQMSISERRGTGTGSPLENVRMIRVDHALNLENEGKEFRDMEFKDLFKLNFKHPLLLRKDFDRYNELLKEYPKLSWG